MEEIDEQESAFNKAYFEGKIDKDSYFKGVDDFKQKRLKYMREHPEFDFMKDMKRISETLVSLDTIQQRLEKSQKDRKEVEDAIVNAWNLITKIRQTKIENPNFNFLQGMSQEEIDEFMKIMQGASKLESMEKNLNSVEELIEAFIKALNLTHYPGSTEDIGSLKVYCDSVIKYISFYGSDLSME